MFDLTSLEVVTFLKLSADAPVELVFRRIQEDSQADIIQYGYKAVLRRDK